MLTLCIRYTIDPNKLASFKAYVEAELDVIRRSGICQDGWYRKVI
jgi:hypothetical protein